MIVYADRFEVNDEPELGPKRWSLSEIEQITGHLRAIDAARREGSAEHMRVAARVYVRFMRDPGLLIGLLERLLEAEKELYTAARFEAAGYVEKPPKPQGGGGWRDTLAGYYSRALRAGDPYYAHIPVLISDLRYMVEELFEWDRFRQELPELPGAVALALLAKLYPAPADRMAWLTTPHRELDEKPPLEVLLNKPEVVRDMLAAALQGLPT